MSYRVGPTRYVNFGPFVDECMDFSLPGLTVIEGIIEGEDLIWDTLTGIQVDHVERLLQK